jgi:hypothetical protein
LINKKVRRIFLFWRQFRISTGAGPFRYELNAVPVFIRKVAAPKVGSKKYISFFEQLI